MSKKPLAEKLPAGWIVNAAKPAATIPSAEVRGHFTAQNAALGLEVGADSEDALLEKIARASAKAERREVLRGASARVV